MSALASQCIVQYNNVILYTSATKLIKNGRAQINSEKVIGNLGDVHNRSIFFFRFDVILTIQI